MSDAITFDKDQTAVLIMDYQNEIMNMLPESHRQSLLEHAEAVLSQARENGLPVIYIAVRFRKGYPEVSPKNKSFSSLKEANRLIEGTAGAEIHSQVAPQDGDVVVTKRRVGAFSTTDLDVVLRSQGISHLVLFGIATSGVVLSTVRWAADMDYKLTVIADACADHDEEVHHVLTEKVFPRQADVIRTADFLKALNFI
ncbi:MAG TPA: isochorismatase family cysteine hydrolase [Balneolales bacterium]|nr:isochorismatase family cysteine hydrolase [Balneolales bacterium]